MMRQSPRERCILCYNATPESQGLTAYTINKARIARIKNYAPVICKMLNLPATYEGKLLEGADICYVCQERMNQYQEKLDYLDQIQRQMQEIRSNVEDLLLGSYRESTDTPNPLDTKRSIMLRNDIVTQLDLVAQGSSIQIVSISSLQEPSSNNFYEEELIIPDIIDVRTVPEPSTSSGGSRRSARNVGRPTNSIGGYRSDHDPDFIIENENSNDSDGLWNPGGGGSHSRKEPPKSIMNNNNQRMVVYPDSSLKTLQNLSKLAQTPPPQGKSSKAVKSTGKPQPKRSIPTPIQPSNINLRKRKEPEVISIDDPPPPPPSGGKAGPASFKKKRALSGTSGSGENSRNSFYNDDDDFELPITLPTDDDDIKCPYSGLRCNKCLSYSHTKLDLAKHLRFRHRKHWKTCSICQEEFKGLDLGPEPPEIPERPKDPPPKPKPANKRNTRQNQIEIVEILEGTESDSDVEDPDEFAGNREIKCEECGLKMKSEKALDKHTWAKHLGNPFACDNCNDTFATKKELEFHVEKSHADEGKEATVAEDIVLTLFCHLCGDAFPNQASMEKHLKWHEDTREFLDLIEKSSNTHELKTKEKEKEIGSSLDDFLSASGFQLDFSNLSAMDDMLDDEDDFTSPRKNMNKGMATIEAPSLTLLQN